MAWRIFARLNVKTARSVDVRQRVGDVARHLNRSTGFIAGAAARWPGNGTTIHCGAKADDRWVSRYGAGVGRDGGMQLDGPFS